MPPQDSEDARSTLIVGLGRTGLSCARYLTARGIPFAVVDSRECPPALDAFTRAFPEVEVILGVFPPAVLAGARCLIVSPGVSTAEPSIAAAARAGATVLGDIEMFAGVAEAPVVAVTGSNGKSTVTTLVGRMAERAGFAVRVGGNLGPPALDLIGPEEPDLYVLELSSFQLETTRTLDAATSVVLNVSPDHMDRYASVQDYVRAKLAVHRGTGRPVVNLDDPLTRGGVGADREPIGFTLSEPGENDYGIRRIDGVEWLCHGRRALLPADRLALAGRHNVANALAALALGRNVGLDWAPMLETLETFDGLPHRCQLVRRLEDVAWYNDSKATNVGATVAAVQGLSGAGRLVLIAGGDGKSASFEPLSGVLGENIRAVVLIGRDAGAIEGVIDPGVTRCRASDMREAVAQARVFAQPGDSVLLSPACASFDMYIGFEARGDDFVRCVMALR